MANGVLICTFTWLFYSMKPQSTRFFIMMKNNTTLWSSPRLLTFRYICKNLLYAYCINFVWYKEIRVVIKMYPELLHVQDTSRVCVLGIALQCNISIAYF